MLLRTPPPEPDESLVGYLLRLTELNHYRSISWILEMLGTGATVSGETWRYLTSSDEGLRLRLAEAGLGHLAEPSAPHADIWATDRRFVKSSWPRLIRYPRPKVCTACLLAKPYYRRVWDLLPFTVCPFHETLLLDRCPRCSRALGWNRKAVARCLCRYDLREAEGISVDKEMTVAFARQDYALVESQSALAFHEESPFANLDFYDLCEIALRLSRPLGRPRHSHSLALTIDNSVVHSAIEEAVQVIFDWPYALRPYCERARSRGHLSFIERRVAHLAAKNQTAFVVLALEQEYRRWVTSPGGKVPLSSLRFLSFDEVRRTLNFDEAQLERLLAHGRLRVLGTEFVDSEHLRTYLARRNELLDLRHIAVDLGVSPKTVKDLVRHNLLECSSGPDIDGFKTMRFERSALAVARERFEQSVASSSPCQSKVGRHRPIPIATLAAKFETRNISLGAFLASTSVGLIQSPQPRTRTKPLPFFRNFAICNCAVDDEPKPIVVSPAKPKDHQRRDERRYRYLRRLKKAVASKTTTASSGASLPRIAGASLEQLALVASWVFANARMTSPRLPNR